MEGLDLRVRPEGYTEDPDGLATFETAAAPPAEVAPAQVEAPQVPAPRTHTEALPTVRPAVPPAPPTEHIPRHAAESRRSRRMVTIGRDERGEGGTTLEVVEHTAGREGDPRLIYVPGYTGWLDDTTGQYAVTADALGEQGYHVTTFYASRVEKVPGLEDPIERQGAVIAEMLDEVLAEQLARLEAGEIQASDIEPLALAGHSMGAASILKAVLARPQYAPFITLTLEQPLLANNQSTPRGFRTLKQFGKAGWKVYKEWQASRRGQGALLEAQHMEEGVVHELQEEPTVKLRSETKDGVTRYPDGAINYSEYQTPQDMTRGFKDANNAAATYMGASKQGGWRTSWGNHLANMREIAQAKQYNGLADLTAVVLELGVPVYIVTSHSDSLLDQTDLIAALEPLSAQAEAMATYAEDGTRTGPSITHVEVAARTADHDSPFLNPRLNAGIVDEAIRQMNKRGKIILEPRPLAAPAGRHRADASQ